jgi:hypothetical protein
VQAWKRDRCIIDDAQYQALKADPRLAHLADGYRPLVLSGPESPTYDDMIMLACGDAGGVDVGGLQDWLSALAVEHPDPVVKAIAGAASVGMGTMVRFGQWTNVEHLKPKSAMPEDGSQLEQC